MILTVKDKDVGISRVRLSRASAAQEMQQPYLRRVQSATGKKNSHHDGLNELNGWEMPPGRKVEPAGSRASHTQ
jgi:hypothetical protein